MTTKRFLQSECPICGTAMNKTKKTAAGHPPTCSVKCGYKQREMFRIQRQQQFWSRPTGDIDRFILGYK